MSTLKAPTGTPFDKPAPSSPVKITTTFHGNTPSRLRSAYQKMGLAGEQDIIRLAVAFFLDKHGL